jgi:NTP pyrophosphatase (non-canonical NTP hydrolase)
VREKSLPVATPPAPPVAEEVEKLVKWLEKYSNSAWPRPDYEEQTIIYCQEREVFDRLTMAAHLLKQNIVVIQPAAVSPREFVLEEMTAEDGSSLGWYVNHSDFYCDIVKEDGVWGIYFRDKNTEQEVFEEQSNTSLASRVLAMCKKRDWSLHWTARGAYLHLEASELIESLRGKRGDPKSEAADVLLVLMSITENAGIAWSDVLKQVEETCSRLEVCDQYASEERLTQAGEIDHLIGWLRENANDERDIDNGGNAAAANILDRIADILEQRGMHR